MIKDLIILTIFLNPFFCFSFDSYDPSSNQLSIPLVDVGFTTYKDVVVNVKNIISVGIPPAQSVVDTFSPETNLLNIPIVKVGTNYYYNVNVSLGQVVSVSSGSVNYLNQNLDSSILSLAGIWQPISDSYINSNINGAHTNSFGNINLFGSKGQSVVLSGWSTSGFSSGTTNSIIPINIGILEYQQDGTLKLQTSKYLNDAKTNGNWLPLIADFNSDGQPDIFLAAHNEAPLLNSSSTAYISNSKNTFDKVVLNDAVMAHQPSLININGNPTVFASTFDASPTIYQYTKTYGFNVNTQNVNPSIGAYGDSHTVGDFIGNGQLNYIGGDLNWGPDFTTHPPSSYPLIKMYPLNSSLLLQTPSVTSFTPYFSSSKYSSFFQNTTNRVLEPRIWTDDFNHDGLLDVVAISGIWSQDSSINWSKSILQMFQNKSNFQFTDVTDNLNSQWDINSDPDYEMQIVDIDKSGIKSYLVGSGSFLNHPNGNGNYILLNDGTGKLYSALHSSFENWSQLVNTYAKNNYSGHVGTTFIDNFRAYVDENGLINYVAQANAGFFNSKNQFTVQDLFINVPTRINISTDFTQNITVFDRNGSMLIRTWAGNDTFYDLNANSSPTKIDGGLGLNTAVYSGTYTQYLINKNVDGTISVFGSNAPVKVNDTLKNIQILKFADQTIFL